MTVSRDDPYANPTISRLKGHMRAVNQNIVCCILPYDAPVLRSQNMDTFFAPANALADAVERYKTARENGTPPPKASNAETASIPDDYPVLQRVTALMDDDARRQTYFVPQRVVPRPQDRHSFYADARVLGDAIEAYTAPPVSRPDELTRRGRLAGFAGLTMMTIPVAGLVALLLSEGCPKQKNTPPLSTQTTQSAPTPRL